MNKDLDCFNIVVEDNIKINKKFQLARINIFVDSMLYYCFLKINVLFKYQLHINALTYFFVSKISILDLCFINKNKGKPNDYRLQKRLFQRS